MSGAVLVVDDDRNMCELLTTSLTQAGFEAIWETSGEKALRTLETVVIDVVVTDLKMPGMSGAELCTQIVADYTDLPVVLITAFGTLSTAISAIHAGAYDFVTKPLDLDQFDLLIARAVRHKRLTQEVVRLREHVFEGRSFGDLIGASQPMKRLFQMLERVAPLDTTVLLTGETGTGKELAARAIHARSGRKKGPFVAVNCAAMPESLLESQLFGHQKGAFTGAHSSHAGLFVQANKGTVLLDEVGEMPLSLQPKLLRAIEQRSVRPVGSNAEISFDARLIAATNRDLESVVEEGDFREDLFYRLNVIEVRLPPLRARGNDILALADHFLQSFAKETGHSSAGISAAAAERLLTYTWPGNVRELRNCIERALALSEHDKIVVSDLPLKVREYKRSHVVVASDNPEELLSLQAVERRYIERVLEAVGGNKTEAARVLGLDRRTLYRKFDRYREIDTKVETSD